MTLEFTEFAKKIRNTSPESIETPDLNKILKDGGADAVIEATNQYTAFLEESGQIDEIADSLLVVAEVLKKAGIERLPLEWVGFLKDSLDIKESANAEEDRQATISMMLEKKPNGLFAYNFPAIVEKIKRDGETSERSYGRIHGYPRVIKDKLIEIALQNPDLVRIKDVIYKLVEAEQSNIDIYEILLDSDSNLADLPPSVFINHIFKVKNRIDIAPNTIEEKDISKFCTKTTMSTIKMVVQSELVLGLDYYLDKKKLLLTPRGQIIIRNAERKITKQNRVGVGTLKDAVQKVLGQERGFYPLLQSIKPTPELDFLLASVFRNKDTSEKIQSEPGFEEVASLIEKNLDGYVYPGGEFTKTVTSDTLPHLRNLRRILSCSKDLQRPKLMLNKLSTICKNPTLLGFDTLKLFLQTANGLKDEEKNRANEFLLRIIKDYIVKHQ